MAEAEKLEKDAEKAKEKAEKPLPALVSPTVNLAVELRQAIALRCRVTGESFSLVSNKLWLKLLKDEGKVKADLNPDFKAAARGGGGMKVKLEERDKEIADLRAQLATLKATKK